VPGGVQKVLNVAGKAAIPLTVAAGAAELYSVRNDNTLTEAQKQKKTGQAIGGTLGTIGAGMAAGAVIGSVIPVGGTIAGALIGGGVGVAAAVGGYFGGRWLGGKLAGGSD